MSREDNARLLRALDAEDMRLRRFGALKDGDSNVIPTLAGQAAALIRQLEHANETRAPDPEHLTRLAAEAIWTIDGSSLESLYAIAESGSATAFLQDRCFAQARAAVEVVLKEMGNG